MQIKVREKENIVILDIEGNIDINASNLIETIGWALISKSKNILCNLEGINLIDYVGISVIAVAYKNVLNHKGKMKIYNTPFHVKNLFSIVGLDRVFDFHESEEEALHYFKEEKVISEIQHKQLRRRFKRIDLRSEIDYRQKFSVSGEFFKGKIMNLSGMGAFIIADKLFSLGELILARLHLLPKPGIIEVDTKVVWIADQEIQPMESPAMGLEFYNLAPDKQNQIIEFVDKHLTHTPEE